MSQTRIIEGILALGDVSKVEKKKLQQEIEKNRQLLMDISYIRLFAEGQHPGSNDKQYNFIAKHLAKETDNQDSDIVKKKFLDAKQTIDYIQKLEFYGIGSDAHVGFLVMSNSMEYALSERHIETFFPDKEKAALVPEKTLQDVFTRLEAEIKRLKKEYAIPELAFKRLEQKIGDLDDEEIRKKDMVNKDTSELKLTKQDRQDIAKDRIENIFLALSKIRLECIKNKYHSIKPEVLNDILNPLKKSMTSTHHYRGWGGDFFNRIRRKLNMGDKVKGQQEIDNIIKIIAKK